MKTLTVIDTPTMFFKCTGGHALAAALARLLWERQQKTFEQDGIDLLVAVPRHWTRRLTRDHDTPQTLGEVLARRLKVRFGRHILAKVRRTPAQAGLPPSKRRVGPKRAFQVRSSSRISSGTLLLVDDILTTGSTVNEASKALRRAGARRVVVAVLARSLGRR